MRHTESDFRVAALSVITGALILLSGVSALHGEITADIDVGYDPYGHMNEVQSPFGGTQITEYNYLGKPIAVQWRGSQIIENAVYGEHGSLESFDYAGLAGQAARRADFTYDALERLTSATLATDGVAGYEYLAEDLRYDERGFLLGLDRADRAVGSVEVAYGYSAQGRLSTFEWGGSRIDYVYDARGNLTDRSGALGVPSMATVHYDLSNRRAGWSYDDAGRLLADDTYRYGYDPAGRLRLVLDRHTGSFVAHYLYDASGQRVRTLEPDGVTYSFRGSEGLVAEIDYDRALEFEQSREHVTFAGREVLQATHTAETTELSLQFTDRLGHPAVSWGDGKTTVHEVSPYGLPLSVGGAAPHRGAYGYTGHEDDDTGLIYMQARYFDPSSARFTRPDPARDFDLFRPSSVNLYQYTYNNPVNFVDPTGLAVSLLIRDASGKSFVHHAALRIHGESYGDPYDVIIDFMPGEDGGGTLRVFDGFDAFEKSQAPYGKLEEIPLTAIGPNNAQLTDDQQASLDTRMINGLLSTLTEAGTKQGEAIEGGEQFAVKRPYRLFTNNCLHACVDFLDAATEKTHVRFEGVKLARGTYNPQIVLARYLALLAASASAQSEPLKE